ncbi:MAG: valine--tRNA ligase [Candidatus Bathyarchaeota archaeon]|nr:valine--tRNA ligase [Candidatus Bathyarchaeota archaeon]
MKPLPKECNILQIEEKWQRLWEEMGVYRFDWNDTKRPVFTIDTPPPYPSGDFHMGNALNHTYFDIVARFKRMRGHNVLFPQGFDCHGLPTEVETEEHYNIKKTDMSPEEFVKLCNQFVDKYISIMRAAIKRLGCSIDWTTEYQTRNPDYWRKTQLSFIQLHKKGYIYQGTHPINWCPRCETAIADAEVEHQPKQGQLHTINFPLTDGGFIQIATTRPELLSSCVAIAVHPEDDRYQKYTGKTAKVPTANQVVKILTDDMVDPEFGTGIVMICTYGDKADVKAVKTRKLPIIMSINENGKMTEKAGKYAGLTTQEAKKAILDDLKTEGLLEKTEQLQQEVGQCWRCHTPIEILERKQWFMKTRKLTPQVVKTANEIKWYPDFMKTRLIDWARSLDWDWVISRQRIFATPIPIWYCKKCNEIILAKEDWLPIDPRKDAPKIEKCLKCGYNQFIQETDVLDTWFDSSISCAVHAGWPDRKDWKERFPADVHPSGTDIIRTWAYYLMVRHLALFNQTPYKSCLINGMVLGTDGRMMHKSLGNYVATPAVFSKYGADAARQWAAAGGATGSDIPFRWPDVEYAWRFLIKLWNAARFASHHLQGYTPNEGIQLGLLDRWLLSNLERITVEVTAALDTCQFNTALEEIRNFTWHQFCDSYIEAVKHRLYKPEEYGEEKKKAAQHTLHTALYRILQLLAPVTPHLTEEIYQHVYAEDLKHKSLHTSPWPVPDVERIDEEAEKYGALIIATIGEIRRDKAERKMPLNTAIKKLVIYAGSKKGEHILNEAMEDIAGTCKTEEIEIVPEKRDGKGREVKEYPNIGFISEY